MYHVKNDKRCIRSAESIMNALEQLMAKKAFLDITITDIQKTAGIGRSTFYRLFDTIDDVVTYMVDREFEEIVRGYSTMSIRDFTIDCLSGVVERGGILIGILSSGKSELVTRSLRENLHRSAEEAGEADEAGLQYRFAVFASACISVIRVWDENGRKESIEELADYMQKYLDFSKLA